MAALAGSFLTDLADPEIEETIREAHRLRAAVVRVRAREGDGEFVWKLRRQLDACTRWLERRGVKA